MHMQQPFSRHYVTRRHSFDECFHRGPTGRSCERWYLESRDSVVFLCRTVQRQCLQLRYPMMQSRIVRIVTYIPVPYIFGKLFSVTSKSTAQAVGVFLTDNRRGIERISIGTPRRCSFAFTVLITEHVGSYWVQGIYGIYLHMVPGRYSESTWYIQHIQYGVGTA